MKLIVRMIYGEFVRRPVRKLVSFFRKKRIILTRKLSIRHRKYSDRINAYWWAVWLEYHLIKSYRTPSVRTGLIAKKAARIEGQFGFESKVKFLRQMKPFLNQDHLKKEFYRYTESRVRPYFRNSLGHHALLDRDYFISICQNNGLKTYLDSFYNSLAGVWSRTMQRPFKPVGKVKGNKIRVLFLVKSWGFVQEYISHLEHSGEIEIDKFDFNVYQTALAELHAKNPNVFDYSFNHLVNSFGPFAPTQSSVWRTACKLCPSLRNKVASADVVFVDWMNFPAAWATKYLPRNTNIVIRCHSYEAFTSFPIYINFSKVSSLIFVSEHIKNIFFELHGRSIKHVNAHVVPNVRDISRFFKPETVIDMDFDERSYNVGMINYSLQTKGPIFVIEVLKHLNLHSNRWKLHLAGKSFEENNTAELGELFFDSIASNELSNHIEIYGFIDDIPAWLANMGYIVSCSEREGTHEAVLEGMAAGCVPALRNWPMVRDFGGPSSVYPGWPTFDEPEQLAKWIIESRENWCEHSCKASNYASGFSIENVAPRITKILRNSVAD